MPLEEYSALPFVDLYAIQIARRMQCAKRQKERGRGGDAKLPDLHPLKKAREKYSRLERKRRKGVFATELWPELVISYYIQVYCKGCGET